MAAIYLLTRSNFFCILIIALVWVLVVRLVLSDRWPCFLMLLLWWWWWLTGHFSFHTHQVKCSSCLLLEILWLSWSIWDLENISKSLKSPLGLLQQWYNHHVCVWIPLLMIMMASLATSLSIPTRSNAPPPWNFLWLSSSILRSNETFAKVPNFLWDFCNSDTIKLGNKLWLSWVLLIFHTYPSEAQHWPLLFYYCMLSIIVRFYFSLSSCVHRHMFSPSGFCSCQVRTHITNFEHLSFWTCSCFLR